MGVSARYSTKTNFRRGFTIIELLVVIVIIIILASIIYLIINPVESARRGRDAIRMSDLSSVFRAITIAIDVAGEPSPQLLCYQTSSPCTGNSDQAGVDTAKSDGTGWVKIKLDTVAGAVFPKLPIDPLNKEGWRYEYRSTGYFFEVNTTFESQEYLEKMNKDGGNNSGKYELGSDLSLIN